MTKRKKTVYIYVEYNIPYVKYIKIYRKIFSYLTQVNVSVTLESKITLESFFTIFKSNTLMT